MTVNNCLRCLLTLLHALTSLGAGFVCLYSLIDWGYETRCFPNLLDQFGDERPFKNSLPVICDSIVFGMAGICVLNFATCLVVNCLWHNACISCFNLLLNIIYLVFAVMGGTSVAVYYIIWCDSLERKFVGSKGCEDAAQKYDISSNTTEQMSVYKIRMEVQMASIWALLPIVGFAVLVCSLTMRTFAKPDARDERYRYMAHNDENAPLLYQSNTSVNERYHSTSTHSLPNVASGSTNPFDG